MHRLDRRAASQRPFPWTSRSLLRFFDVEAISAERMLSTLLSDPQASRRPDGGAAAEELSVSTADANRFRAPQATPPNLTHSRKSPGPGRSPIIMTMNVARKRRTGKPGRTQHLRNGHTTMTAAHRLAKQNDDRARGYRKTERALSVAKHEPQNVNQMLTRRTACRAACPRQPAAGQ